MKEQFEYLQRLIDETVKRGLFTDAKSVINIQQAYNDIKKEFDAMKENILKSSNHDRP